MLLNIINKFYTGTRVYTSQYFRKWYEIYIMVIIIFIYFDISKTLIYILYIIYIVSNTVIKRPKSN